MFDFLRNTRRHEFTRPSKSLAQALLPRAAVAIAALFIAPFEGYAPTPIR